MAVTPSSFFSYGSKPAFSTVSMTAASLLYLRLARPSTSLKPVHSLSMTGEHLSISGDSSETRFEIRKRYWTYALTQIHEAHGNPGSFSNVNPSTDNWINGFFGIGGFYLCCVANFDSARSEVVFARAERSENKAAFDALYQHKSEIESKLGTELQWNRGDDIKSSKVFIQLDNVSIENEDDWPQMAKFHAEWSKKFYDLIVPYITVDWQ